MRIGKYVTVSFTVVLLIGFFTSCTSTKNMYPVEHMSLGISGLVIKEFDGNGGRELTNALLSEFRKKANRNAFLIWNERQYEAAVRRNRKSKGNEQGDFLDGFAFLSGEVIVYDFSKSEKQIMALTNKLANAFTEKNELVSNLQGLFKSNGVATVVVNFAITDIKTGKNISAKTIAGRKANSILSTKPGEILLLLAVNKVARLFVNSIR
ncbi:MAG: hypothetical protein KAW12_01645 [Candidatus Aminicenantes bacterium]|nr:hypothetical protein [Candidatus Aminicenantes bacterium]